MFKSKQFFLIFFVLVIALALLNFVFWNPSSDKNSPLHEMRITRVIELPKSVTDLSGITFDPTDNTLYAISNKPPEVFKISLKGELLQSVRLKGFSDTEGIEFLSKGLFAVIDESHYQIITIKIPENINQVHYSDGIVTQLDTTSYKERSVKNRGIEGITLDANGNLIVANEQYPALIGEVNQNNDGNNFHLSNTFIPPGRDVAGLHYWVSKNALLVLSEASKKINVFDADGKHIGTYQLTRDRLGLWPRIEQPEGITVDNQNRIYIAAEPNFIYVLE